MKAVWAAVGVLTAIGVAVVARRATALIHGSAAGLDAGFSAHPILTAAHIVPGLLFVLLGPLQFVSGLRKRHPTLHRWAGRTFLAAGVVVATTALAMGPQMAIGGRVEAAATTFFAAVLLAETLIGFLRIRRRQIAAHRRWMIRAYAIGLAVTTTRPIVGLFFATSRLTHLTPAEFFGPAFWLGFTLHAVAAEAWISRSARG